MGSISREPQCVQVYGNKIGTDAAGTSAVRNIEVRRASERCGRCNNIGRARYRRRKCHFRQRQYRSHYSGGAIPRYNDGLWKPGSALHLMAVRATRPTGSRESTFVNGCLTTRSEARGADEGNLIAANGRSGVSFFCQRESEHNCRQAHRNKDVGWCISWQYS